MSIFFSGITGASKQFQHLKGCINPLVRQTDEIATGFELRAYIKYCTNLLLWHILSYKGTVPINCHGTYFPRHQLNLERHLFMKGLNWFICWFSITIMLCKQFWALDHLFNNKLSSFGAPLNQKNSFVLMFLCPQQLKLTHYIAKQCSFKGYYFNGVKFIGCL